MATAKRRINSTGRKRIARESVDIRMGPIRDAEPAECNGQLFGQRPWISGRCVSGAGSLPALIIHALRVWKR